MEDSRRELSGHPFAADMRQHTAGLDLPLPG